MSRSKPAQEPASSVATADTMNLTSGVLSSFEATAPLKSPSLPERLRASVAAPGDAATFPLAGTQSGDLGLEWAATEALSTSPLRAGFDAIGATLPFASLTATLAAKREAPAPDLGVTMPLAPGVATGGFATRGDLSAVSEEAVDEATAELQAKLKADPSDVDALFKLAIRLHRTGRVAESRATIVRLATVYEERGQPAQAMRIRHMLGDASDPAPAGRPGGPGTSLAPFAPTVGLPNLATSGLSGSPTVGLLPTRTSRLAGSATAAMPTAPTMAFSAATGGLTDERGSGRGTGALGLTARLRQTGVTGLGGTVALRTTGLFGPQAAADQDGPTVAAFPPSALSFTIPLPEVDTLSSDVQALVAESDEDLRAGRLDAALDVCHHLLIVQDDFVPVSIRIAEIYTVKGQRRAARVHAETLLHLMQTAESLQNAWMAYRVLLHTADRDLGSLRSMVELLIDAGQTEHASYYASRLIRLLDGEGLTEDALAYSERLCELIPSDTRAALENAVLRLKTADPGGAVDRWEIAVAAGADPIVARTSLAAVMASFNEDDHWRLLAEVTPSARADRAVGTVLLDAYARTAEVMASSTILAVGRGVLMEAMGENGAAEVLARTAGDRAASPLARAVGSVIMARLLGPTGAASERGAALRTALKLLADPEIASNPVWLGLNDTVPRFEDLSLELGELLLAGHDPAGAAEVLKAAHERVPHHDQVCTVLADAYFRTGQLGAALTVLDGLVAHYRGSGQLETMAGVLRRMSQMAPNNIKVKARLIDTYLQRGFVAEARAELIQRAELEERSGLIKDAVTSLQRAADLSWNVGMADETFTLYQRAIGLVPDLVDYRHALVALYLQAGRLAEAAEHQRAIVDISLQAGRKHEAVAALHQVIGLTPDDTSAYYQLGELLSNAGEYGQAERVYRRILTITPDDAIAQAKVNSMASLHERRTA